MNEYLIREDQIKELADIVREKNLDVRIVSDRANFNTTSLPGNLTSIGDYTFYDCKKLSLTSLPENLTTIGIHSFSGCSNLSLTSLPESITSVGDYAFFGCRSLISITLKGTPTVISSSTFQGCINLTTINVPWAEDDVANAPWGATNATINYNYIGG